MTRHRDDLDVPVSERASNGTAHGATDGIDGLPAGWLTRARRGFVSGASIVLIAVLSCSIPALVVWLVPGADSSAPMSAIKSAGLVVVSASHGGVRLDGTATHLAPLLVTIFIGWLLAGSARRMDSTSGAVGLSIGYGLAAGVLASWARLGATFAPFWPSVLYGVLFAAAVGGLARLRDVHWQRLSGRWRAVLRASVAVTLCYLTLGALLAGAALATHLSDAASIQRQVAPGAGGLPIALLGVAATPNAALLAVGYLTGPGFHLGSGTSVSVLSTSHGQLPLFPMLAGVPSGRPATTLGVGLIAIAALLAGGLAFRMAPAGGTSSRRLLDCAVIGAVAACLLALLTGLAGGGIGDGALAGIGASWWAVGGMTVALVLAGSLVWSTAAIARRAWAGSRTGQPSAAGGPSAASGPGAASGPAVTSGPGAAADDTDDRLTESPTAAEPDADSTTDADPDATADGDPDADADERPRYAS